MDYRYKCPYWDEIFTENIINASNCISGREFYYNVNDFMHQKVTVPYTNPMQAIRIKLQGATHPFYLRFNTNGSTASSTTTFMRLYYGETLIQEFNGGMSSNYYYFIDPTTHTFNVIQSTKYDKFLI